MRLVYCDAQVDVHSWAMHTGERSVSITSCKNLYTALTAFSETCYSDYAPHREQQQRLSQVMQVPRLIQNAASLTSLTSISLFHNSIHDSGVTVAAFSGQCITDLLRAAPAARQVRLSALWEPSSGDDLSWNQGRTSLPASSQQVQVYIDRVSTTSLKRSTWLKQVDMQRT
jgi:hypothetical protein